MTDEEVAVEFCQQRDSLQKRIDKAIKYIDKLLEFGIRNEYVDLNEIKLYLIKDDYKDITLRNLENYGNSPIRYEEIEDFIKNELEGEKKNESSNINGEIN